MPARNMETATQFHEGFAREAESVAGCLHDVRDRRVHLGVRPRGVALDH